MQKKIKIFSILMMTALNQDNMIYNTLFKSLSWTSSCLSNYAHHKNYYPRWRSQYYPC